MCNGLDLATEWRARRWQKLLDIIERLPRHSAYIEAITDDELIAERLALEPPPTDTSPRRRMSEYNAEVEMLSLLADRIAELIGTVAASRGIRPRKIPPAPRPVTAMERVRQRRRHATHRYLVSKLLPHKADGAPSAVAQEPPARPVRAPVRRALPTRTQPPGQQPGSNPPRTNRSGWSSP